MKIFAKKKFAFRLANGSEYETKILIFDEAPDEIARSPLFKWALRMRAIEVIEDVKTQKALENNPEGVASEPEKTQKTTKK